MNMTANLIGVIISLVVSCSVTAAPKLGDNYTFKEIEGEGLNLFHADKTLPIARFVDKDEDGEVDYMIIHISDSSDKSVRDLYDYNFDGIPDARIEFDTGKLYVMYKDAWHRVFHDKKAKTWHIIVNGKNMFLDEENSLLMKYHAKTHNKAAQSDAAKPRGWP